MKDDPDAYLKGVWGWPYRELGKHGHCKLFVRTLLYIPSPSAGLLSIS